MNYAYQLRSKLFLSSSALRNVYVNWSAEILSLDMSYTGEIRELFRSKTVVCFEWRIWKIFSMLKKVGANYGYFSPSIEVSDIFWYLEIFSYGVSPQSEEWIGFRIVKSHLEKSGRFTLGIRKADGTEEKIVHDQNFHEHRRDYILREFVKRSELLNRKSQLAPFDVFTVICTIRRDEPPSVGEKNISSSGISSDSLTATSATKDESAHLDSKEKNISSFGISSDSLTGNSARKGERAHLDSKAKYIYPFGTVADSLAAIIARKGSGSALKDLESVHLDSKGNSLLVISGVKLVLYFAFTFF